MAGRKAKTQRAVDDDAVMALVAQEMLVDPNACPTPDFRRAMLERFLELLGQESVRRPAHRPRGNTGHQVQILIEAGMPQARAREWIAKRAGKTRVVVARAHNRYLREMRQK